MNRAHSILLFAAAFCIMGASAAHAQDTVKLPEPRIRGEVMKSLRDRISIKGFSTKELPADVLSGMLWTGFGVADPATGRRTAPSAFNVQEIIIYVVRADGAYHYDAAGNCLVRASGDDLRGLVAGQDYAKAAPVHLVYVADYDRARKVYPKSYGEQMKAWAMLHAGFVAQNVTLYCASHRLCAVVRTAGNEAALAIALALREGQSILISHAIGYPPY